MSSTKIFNGETEVQTLTCSRWAADGHHELACTYLVNAGPRAIKYWTNPRIIVDGTEAKEVKVSKYKLDGKTLVVSVSMAFTMEPSS